MARARVAVGPQDEIPKRFMIPIYISDTSIHPVTNLQAPGGASSYVKVQDQTWRRLEEVRGILNAL